MAITDNINQGVHVYSPTEKSMGNVEVSNASSFSKLAPLYPTVGVIALGILLVPNFGLGLVAGGLLIGVSHLEVKAIRAVKGMEPSDNSAYLRELKSSPFSATVVAPALEECVFRGGIQTLITQSILPITAATMFGPFSVASVIAILVTSLIFGAVHASNPHKNAHVQAVVTTIGGIAFGCLFAQYGLGASIAAHIMNNTISVGRLFNS